jgi:hypothetical protein
MIPVGRAPASSRPHRAVRTSIPGAHRSRITTTSPEDLGLAELDDPQRSTFGYFLELANPRNGLVPDSTRAGAPSSIAVVGLALAACAVGAERGYLTRAEAVARVLTTLRFFRDSPQGEQRDATGHRGFYYHFLDMNTGRRAWASELSTIDTTLLIAGALTAAAYFDGEAAGEREIVELADTLYRRIDWDWARNGGLTVAHAWKPGSGFLKSRWEGYSEAILLYALGLGSPTHPLPPASYQAWTRTYRWRTVYGHEYLYAGPLFIHQLSHVWIDFRGIRDEPMREHGIDYHENSRRATFAQRDYAIRNPRRFRGYGECCWGITACAGPGPARRRIDGVERCFYDYRARGIPFGPDDGTLAPWAVVASLPFAPEIVLPAIRHLREAHPGLEGRYGLLGSYNQTFDDPSRQGRGWQDTRHFGLEQGPIVLMIENYRSGLLWSLMRRCPHLVTGLRRAGFGGGWLASDG